MGSVVKSIGSAIGDVGESVVKTAGSAVNVVTATVSGGSTRQALADTLSNATDVGMNLANVGTAGQLDKVDVLSGGLITATKNAQNTASDLVAGKSVKDNLKDAVRVGAVIGTAYATGGSSLGSQIGGTLAVNNALSKNGQTNLNLKSAIGAVGAYGTGNDVVDSVLKKVSADTPTKNSRVGSSGVTTEYSNSLVPTQSSSDTSSNTPIIIVGVIIVAIATFLIIKKK